MRDRMWHGSARTSRAAAPWFARYAFAALLAAAGLGATGLGRAQTALEDGEKLYRQLCVSCHTIGGGRLVGPDLKGVTERRSRDWLVRFIADPEQMRKEDPVAIANLKEFGVPMPRLGLGEREIAALLAYFETAQPAPAGTPPLYVPTLVLSFVAALALTLIALVAGTKKVNGDTA